MSGKVTFSGEIPRPNRLLITRDMEVCGEGYRKRREIDVTDEGGLRNVVIVIDGIAKGKAWPQLREGYVVDQVNCYFDPFVQVMRRGADLNIVNSDPVLHNIHGSELIGKTWRTLFNFGQPPEKGTITQPLRPRRGRQIRLECDAHDFMLGWIYAVDNPYAVVVDSTGHFTIDDIPPGKYTIKAWHPRLGLHEQVIVLSGNQTGEITFQFSNN